MSVDVPIHILIPTPLPCDLYDPSKAEEVDGGSAGFEDDEVGVDEKGGFAVTSI